MTTPPPVPMTTDDRASGVPASRVGQAAQAKTRKRRLLVPTRPTAGRRTLLPGWAGHPAQLVPPVPQGIEPPSPATATLRPAPGSMAAPARLLATPHPARQ